MAAEALATPGTGEPSPDPSEGSSESPHLAHHFASLGVQAHAARLGMWIFLGTEVLLFGVLFAGYASYRTLYPAAFAAGSHHLDRAFGTIDTLVLITSSFTVAMAHHLNQAGRTKLAAAAVGATIALGLGFLALHGHEYATDIARGALPGRLYHGQVLLPGVGLFYTLYFFMTGLHSIHVVLGVTLLAWLARRTARGDFSQGWDTPLELGALYWHLIDLIWIFLYPLLYLI
jgi:cytochrome c oxidase subunit 3